MKFTLTFAVPQLAIYSSVLFSMTVISSLTNLQFQHLNYNDSDLLIDKKFGHVNLLNSSTFVEEGKASIILHPKKQFWIEQIARKLAPFFSVISFWNEKCWTTGYDQGTCYSRKECIAKGGTPNGMCAAGFGVCCVFSYSCDSATAFNRTYFLNPEFPYTIHEFGICPHSIHKLEDICQVRLDFEVLELARPNKHGLCEEDTFTIHGTDFNMPSLCGDLTGHHLYLPVGYDSKITMQVSLLSGNPWGRWKIRTTKIKCSSSMLAPPGCQQHLYGLAGRITSFNYFHGEESNMNHLNYGVCVRKERGFCAIQWTLCNEERRKRRSVKSPGVTQLDVQKADVTNPDFNEIVNTKSLKTTSRTMDPGFSISRSYSGVHVSRPRLNYFGSNDDVRCQNKRNLLHGNNRTPRNSSLLQIISCPKQKIAINQKHSASSEDWRPFVPKTNYYVQHEPQNSVRLEHRILEEQIGVDSSHVWLNSDTVGKRHDHNLNQVHKPINSSPSSGMKNPNPILPIRVYKHHEEPLRAFGSESVYMSNSNPIPNGNQLHYLREKPHLKSGKDPFHGIREKVVGIKIPFYTKPRHDGKKHVSVSGSADIHGEVDINSKPGHGILNHPIKPISKPMFQPGFLSPIHHKPILVHPASGQFPLIQENPNLVGQFNGGANQHIHVKPKPTFVGGGGFLPIGVKPNPTFGGGSGAVTHIGVKPKPTFVGGNGGILPIGIKPKPTFVGGNGGVPPIGIKSKPTFVGGTGGIPPIGVKPKPIGISGASLLQPGKIKVHPKPLVNNGFGLLGRPKVKPKPTLQHKPWGHKDKNKGNCTGKPKVILVPVPIPLPIPIPIPIVPVVVVPFPFGGGGGGGGGGWGSNEGEKPHKVISATEPYIIRIVTDDEREEGLSSFCMDWEQIPCDIWWTTHHSEFSGHNDEV